MMAVANNDIYVVEKLINIVKLDQRTDIMELIISNSNIELFTLLIKPLKILENDSIVEYIFKYNRDDILRLLLEQFKYQFKCFNFRGLLLRAVHTKNINMVSLIIDFNKRKKEEYEKSLLKIKGNNIVIGSMCNTNVSMCCIRDGSNGCVYKDDAITWAITYGLIDIVDLLIPEFGIDEDLILVSKHYNDIEIFKLLISKYKGNNISKLLINKNSKFTKYVLDNFGY
jgi:hypothetical protein